MIQNPNQKASAEYLRWAQPRLICRVHDLGNRRYKPTFYISEVERGWDEVLSEGYDPDGSPLRRPVYWRIVKRGGEQLYHSTFLLEADSIIKGWGPEALVYCDPTTGMAVVRNETLLTE